MKAAIKLSQYLLVFFSGLLVSCSTPHSSTNSVRGNGVALFYALAYMQPMQENRISNVTGTVGFTEGFGQVKIHVNINGLDKNAKHAIHIHEFGDCSGFDAAHAGEDFNPTNSVHGSPFNDEPHHAGDLGNLIADKKGRAEANFEIKGISINGSLNPIIGRSVIIHSYEDDFISQPMGAAGPIISCGIIGAVGNLKNH